MKRILVVTLVGWSISILGMEPKTYLELLPQDLRQELAKFTTNLENVFTIKKLQEKLGEIEQRVVHLKGLSSLVQALNTLQQQLELIKNAKYEDALALIKELSQNKGLESFFNNPDFIRIIIHTLWPKALREGKYNIQEGNIAQELNTPGALEYSKQLQFIKAAHKGDIKTVQEFLSKGINVNAKAILGTTALMSAGYGRKDIVQMLLAHKADVNAQDHSGQTALIYAALRGDKNIVEVLIVQGCRC